MADFDTVNKRFEEILKDPYVNQNFAGLKFENNQNGLKSTVNLWQRLSYTPSLTTSQGGDLKLKYKNKNVAANTKLNVTGANETEIEYTQNVNGLQRAAVYAHAHGNVLAQALKLWRVGATVQKNNVTGTLELEDNGKERFLVDKILYVRDITDQTSGTYTAGYDVRVSYNLRSRVFSPFRTLAWFHQRNLTLLGGIENPQRDSLQYKNLWAATTYRINDNYAVASKIEHDLPSAQTTLTVGGEGRVNNDLTLNARVDNNFNLALSATVAVNRWIRFVVSNATALNPARATAKENNAFPIGFRIDINN
jgi:hypothetical protein